MRQKLLWSLKEMCLLFGFLCVLLHFSLHYPLPLPSRDDGSVHPTGTAPNDLALATKYLQQFYSFQADASGRRRRSRPSFSSKLKDMQSFFGLNRTGTLNSETMVLMKTPRCGVPDVDDYHNRRGNRWMKNLVTYDVGRYTSHLPVNTVDALIASALEVWAKASPLTFLRSFSHQADIMVEFVRNDHGDFFPFDGPDGTLAHAFGPGDGIGGDVHFDEAESWTAEYNGFNLFVVATHEFGHALGLKHSQNPESVMFPTYKSRKTHSLLSSEDIMNINTLYGPSNKWSNPSLRFSWNNPSSPWASASHLPGYMWIKHNNRNDVKEGPISNFMPRISGQIDAAYWVAQRSAVYLFNGTLFWTMKGTQVKGRVKNISSLGFPSWVRQIDAAVHIHKTVDTLFFTQNQYNEHDKTMSESSPRNISDDFPQIKGPISAAMYKDGCLHFFAGPDVYEYDIKQKKIIAVDKPSSWLGC
ncbi:hypothetical protein DNTS_030040 [Danionella cerebrum]|uniref:Peptidase metallopeptidase domain-containing protein n=1 Tax=Danionella cerebrum TaxID=2873325 RepID=A0A553R2C9_9TELE|nr:hypothetical protein DNTS_030040 [Danionella translucida]